MKSKILFRYLHDDTLLAVHHDNQQVADVQGAPRHPGQADYFDIIEGSSGQEKKNKLAFFLVFR